MSETTPGRRFKTTDIIIGIVLLAIVGGLLGFLLKQLNLKHEVAAAQVTSDRIIADIKANKAADARSIAVASFQKNHSTEDLTNLFQAANSVAKGSTTIASRTVTNTKDSQNVGIVYQYSGSKTPYFIRVITTKDKGSSQWQLAGLSGGSDQTKLENNQ